MKKVLAVVALLSVSTLLFAAGGNIWRSSNTAVADTTLNLCKGITQLVGTSTITTGNHGIFHGACVNRGLSGGTLAIYNSSASATSPIATISVSTPMPCSVYDVGISSGLTYTNSGTADITILYQCW